MRYVLEAALIIFISMFASTAGAEGQSVRFTEDPVLYPGLGFHAQVESDNISVQDTECLVHVYFPDGDLGTWEDPGDSYLNKGDHGGKYQFIAFEEQYLTLQEIVVEAKNICWPQS